MLDIEKSCCFTGYRPEKFSFPFETDCPEHRQFIGRLMTAIACRIEDGCRAFYTGMAMGFDIVAAEQVALIKKRNRELRLIGVVPFKGQEEKWNKDWKERYYAVLNDCDEVVTLSDTYERWAFDRRNRFMVDRSRYVITYFDGKPGGTGNTLKYAAKHGREVFNIYETDPIGDVTARFNARFVLLPPEDNQPAEQ